MAPPTVLTRFNPPAFLKDLKTEQALQEWSDQLSLWMDDEIAGEPRGRTPLKQFFNGTKTAFDQTADPVNITWIGFPKLVCHELESINLDIADQITRCKAMTRIDGKKPTRVEMFRTSILSGQ
jgi:hypothetical protein